MPGSPIVSEVYITFEAAQNDHVELDLRLWFFACVNILSIVLHGNSVL